MPQSPEHLEFMQRVQAARAAREQARRDALQTMQKRKMETSDYWDERNQALSTMPKADPKLIPTSDSIYTQKREEQKVAEAEAERARQAALTPRQIWLSSLSFAEAQRIARWELVNRMPYPMPTSQQ